MFLDSLSISYRTIKAGMKIYERSAAARIFNNPASNCQILLTTFECGSFGLNLHYACSRAIVLESPRNYSTLLHVIGRLHRLGQKENQKVWILFADHTIDRYLECINANKAIPQFASQLGYNLVKAHVAEMLRSNKSLKKREATRLVTKSLADGAMMKQFGHVRSRMEMRNPKKLDRNGNGHPVRGGSASGASISPQQADNSSPRSLIDAPSSGMPGQTQHSLKRPAEDSQEESSETEVTSRQRIR
ncbi:C-terminal helicase domain-containing protein [Aspergillus stella-maris]|uniref:C-terminal helicase domain-containing protein n=1 Tax=Aspergillus stella-maris TaxID=1810926 RepID=UPI003CCD538B